MVAETDWIGSGIDLRLVMSTNCPYRMQKCLFTTYPYFIVTKISTTVFNCHGFRCLHNDYRANLGCFEFAQRAPNPPELAQPPLSRSNSGHPQREGTNLGVFVPIWLVLPRSESTIWVCLICVISPHSNGAVQSRVGLELADY